MQTRATYKVSGESLSSRSHGATHAVEIDRFRFVAEEIHSVIGAGHEVLLVVGGGNFFRGSDQGIWPLSRREADEVGMIATAMNALLLRSVLRDSGLCPRVFSRGILGGLEHRWSADSADDWLRHHRVAIVAGGVGIPFVSSDYAAVHHAVELNATRVLAAKNRTDGVYDSDPNANPRARKFNEVSCSTIIKAGIEVMDFASIDLARRFGVEIDVFDALLPGAALSALTHSGFPGTVIHPH